MMEDSLSLKASWGADAKAMQQCLTDIFTSVYTTCDIPENAIFGPCILSHTSLYDSIAFIALKSTDKRTAPYIFRVDTSAGCGSSEGLAWLRLVQSARDGEEQNLEAYVKNGQLFYRSLRRIEKDEELLVWYGKDLTALLLLSFTGASGKSKGAPPYLCQDCNQRFQFEFPFLAHLRFCCTKGLYRMNGADGDSADRLHHGDLIPLRPSPEPLRSDRRSNSRDAKPATDFHNLARDLENSRTRPPSSKEAEIRSGSKRKYSEEEEEEKKRSRSSSKSPVSKEGLECASQQCGEAFDLGESRRPFSPSRPEPVELKKSAFTEVRKASESLRQSLRSGESGGAAAGRALASVRLALTEARPPPHAEGPARKRAFRSVPRDPDRKSAARTRCATGPRARPFLFAAPYWPKALRATRVPAPSALTLLPPSFTSLCLPAQNWCAKCNASFRMTSDLVYHMRSHHKRELSVEPLVKRRREEKLKCPVCNEAFRERHHLSRHMTSHN
ncbi:hypothetical protein ANANG_G00259560 [Anguilla anguilla]|uniref:PR domain zinc finger protein 8 n=1 Tax=Anguilla anguilla TaxID=7936 RepID=A0A9D3LRI7_ANGAN|nr:hypothetical protein ANANG_G00259560 [Anguilla anguilla]